MSDPHKFQVNLRGIIDLLSKHLYSDPQVYLRELLQNGVDAITARQHHQPNHAGEIKLELVAGNAGNLPTLVVYDNGVGLTEEEVHKFLATIGSSSKRESLSREDFLGQFGIGLLSGFVVSEEIVVITRSIHSDGQTLKWCGRADGTYDVETLDYEIDAGTQVFLRCKPGCQDFFDLQFVQTTAKYFGSLLPHSIEVSAGEERYPINEAPPWRVQHDNPAMQHEALMEFGETLFQMKFLDAIPLRSTVGQVEGVAYVLPGSTRGAGKRTHRVYLKNMLLSEKAENLLPDWAFFVKCVVNANDLRPTASRESFYEDDGLAECRADLGQALKDYLVGLAETDRDRLDRLIDLHYLSIKALAIEDDDFFRLFIDWLPFETSLGQMTLGEYRKRQKVVRFVVKRDQFRQISPVASAQNLCIINAGYVYDRELLEKLPDVLPNVSIEQFEVEDLSHAFEDLTMAEQTRAFDFLKMADVVLQRFRCSADMKKFNPQELPTLYTSNDAASFLRSIDQSKDVSEDLWSGVLDRMSDSPAANAYAELCMNYKNPLIKKLSGLKDPELIRRSVEMLYVQALLLGHYPLRAQEMSLMSEGLLGLIELGISARTLSSENETETEEDNT